MSKSEIIHPEGMHWPGIDVVTTSVFNSHTQFNLSGDDTTDGVAIPWPADGSQVKKIEIRFRSGSQAGEVTAEIQKGDETADVNHTSGMPDGTAITNGSGSASVAGGSDEITTITLGTAPTPKGFHYLVLTSTGTTHDLEISYQADWVVRNNTRGRLYDTRYYDGSDWNQVASVGRPAVRLLDENDNVIQAFADVCPPFWTLDTSMTEVQQADNKECVGVLFSPPTNLTTLKGFYWAPTVMGADMNVQWRLYEKDGTAVTGGIGTIINQQAVGSSSRSVYVGCDEHITLDPTKEYRLFTFNTEDTADDISTHYFDLDSADDQATYFGMESGEWAMCTATDPAEAGFGGSGSWTDDDTKLPFIGLVFSQDVGDISGGGGATETSYAS